MALGFSAASNFRQSNAQGTNSNNIETSGSLASNNNTETSGSLAALFVNSSGSNAPTGVYTSSTSSSASSDTCLLYTSDAADE